MHSKKGVLPPPKGRIPRSCRHRRDAAGELPPPKGACSAPQMSYPARSPQVPRAHIHPPPPPLRCRRRCHARCRPPRGWIGRWAGRLKLLVTRQQMPLPSCCRCWPSRCCLRGCSRCCSPRCCPLCRAAWPWLPWPQLCASLSRACAAGTRAGMTRVRSSGLLIPVEVFFLFSTIVAIVQVRSTCAIAAACATPCHIGSSAPRACCLVRTDRRCACSCALHFASHCGAAGAARKCKNRKWPKNEVSGSGGFGRSSVNFTGVRPFWPLKTQNFFWWARRARGLATLGGPEGARESHFQKSPSFCYRYWEPNPWCNFGLM